MSVPYHDTKMLWELNPEAFNEWRSKNDIPILFSFFKERLPSFQVWLDEFDIDQNTFCNALPTGQLFVGQDIRILIQNPEDQMSPGFFTISELSTERIAHGYKTLGKSVPEMKIFTPYFYWAKNRLKGDRFITSDPANQEKSDTFVYNLWTSPDLPASSRASLFSTFQVLKLGGIKLGMNTVIGGRNLDFTDLDHLVIEGGEWHGSRQTYIHFSSCLNIYIGNTSLAFYRFVHCNIQRFTCNDCRLQDFFFDHSIMTEANFVQCKLNFVVFDGCNVSAEFDKCDLWEVKYLPKKGTLPADIQMYRRLRTVYQSTGKRREASRCYYLERKTQRQALFNSLVYFSIEFPRTPHPGPIRYIIDLWKQKKLTRVELIQHILRSVFFRLKIELKYKARYLLSLIEELVWGYGEKPIRIILTALSILSTYTIAYYKLLNPVVTSAKYSWIDCMYFSVVTFTTLGYGDITPKTELQKIICGSEALLGALLIGLIVAGFANKSKY